MKRLRRVAVAARDRRGQSLVEFGLVSLTLVMLLFGVIEMCRLALVYTTIANAARVGVRYATVHGTDNSVTVPTIQGVVNSYLSAATVYAVNPPKVCYASFIYTNCPQTPTAPGTPVTVQVSYTYNPITSYFPIHVILSSTSQGEIAF